MCLIYNHTKTQSLSTEDRPLVMYKLYLIRHETDCLESPYRYHAKGGTINKAGTYLPRLDGIFYETTQPMGVKTTGEALLSDQLPEFDGYSISISGFHCFETLEAAEAFVKGSFPAYGIVRIVKVTSHTKYLIASGKTPFYPSSLWEQNRMAADTLVVSKMTISEEDFSKAMNMEPQCV